MSRLNLTAGTRYKLDGKIYEIRKASDDDKYEVTELGLSCINTVTEDYIIEALNNRGLTFTVYGINAIVKEEPLANSRKKREKHTKAPYSKRLADKEYIINIEEMEVERPLQRTEIVSTIVDMLIFDEKDGLIIGRPTITTSLDKYTSEPCGISIAFEPPNLYTASSCLYDTFFPKDYIKMKYPKIENEWNVYGIPESIAIEGGDTSKDFINVCCQLKINVVEMPIRVPWYRASIERYFRTLCNEMLYRNPGATFLNFVDKIDYDPYKMAICPLSAFLELLYIFICDIYSQKYHKGINAIPNQLWNEHVDKISRAYQPTKEELAATLLYRTDYRAIQKYGIDFRGIRYNDERLSAIYSSLHNNENPKLKIKYNPNDMSHLLIYDNVISQQYITVKSIDQSYTQGLSLWKHNAITNYVRKSREGIDMYSLAKAKEEIQKAVKRELQKPKKTMSRLAKYQSVMSVHDNTVKDFVAACTEVGVPLKQYINISATDCMPGSSIDEPKNNDGI